MVNSFRERKHVTCEKPFLPKSSFLMLRGREGTDTGDLQTLIFEGLWAVSPRHKDRDSYYAERVENLLQSGNTKVIRRGSQEDFRSFLTDLALYSGEILNCFGISKKLGIMPATCQRWIQILKNEQVIFLLPGLTDPALKKTAKSPKLYFMDTGLLAWLNEITSPELLKEGENARRFFTNYVIAEIMQSHTNAQFYHYRNANLVEIELVIEIAGTLHPLRILPDEKVNGKTLSPFTKLDPVKEDDLRKIGSGGVVCFCPKLLHLDRMNFAIPAAYL